MASTEKPSDESVESSCSEDDDDLDDHAPFAFQNGTAICMSGMSSPVKKQKKGFPDLLTQKRVNKLVRCFRHRFSQTTLWAKNSFTLTLVEQGYLEFHDPNDHLYDLFCSLVRYKTQMDDNADVPPALRKNKYQYDFNLLNLVCHCYSFACSCSEDLQPSGDVYVDESEEDEKSVNDRDGVKTLYKSSSLQHELFPITRKEFQQAFVVFKAVWPERNVSLPTQSVSSLRYSAVYSFVLSTVLEMNVKRREEYLLSGQAGEVAVPKYGVYSSRFMKRLEKLPKGMVTIDVNLVVGTGEYACTLTVEHPVYPVVEQEPMEDVVEESTDEKVVLNKVLKNKPELRLVLEVLLSHYGEYEVFQAVRDSLSVDEGQDVLDCWESMEGALFPEE